MGQGDGMADTDTRRQLRSFGLLVGGIFGLIGLWPMVWRHQSPRLWAVTLAVAMTTGISLVSSCFLSSRNAVMPSIWAMRMSITIICGFSRDATSTTSEPSFAVTNWYPACSSCFL